MTTSYIAYYRVSTQRQGESGLGLEAQEETVNQFCVGDDRTVVSVFKEVESGKRRDRPELAKALEACKELNATLLIAKLDRLARNVHFISGLLESGVNFVAVDMPNADRFMLHVYAAVAEEEARRISERTRSALAAAKARGTKLGKNGSVLAAKSRADADAFARIHGPKVDQMRSTGAMSYREISESLNLSQLIPNTRGGRWHVNSVHRLHKRYQTLISVCNIADPHRYSQATAT